MHSSRDGAFKSLEHRVQILSLPMHVNTTSPLAIIDIGHIFAHRKIEMTVVTGRLIRMDARPADGRHEQATNREGRIAHRLCGIAIATLAGQQPIKWILRAKFCRYERRLPIRAAADDQLQHVLDVPSTAHEFDGEHSSNSGLSGAWPCPPKSSSLAAMPRPKSRYQRRFTITRDVRPPAPFLESVNQLAKSSRVARWPPVSSLPKNVGMAGSTTSPVLSNRLPRENQVIHSSIATVIIVLRGFDESRLVPS